MSLPLTRRIARAALLVAAGAAAGVGAAGSASAAPELPAAPNVGGLTSLDAASVGTTLDGATQSTTGLATDAGGKAVQQSGKTGGKAVKKAAPAAQKAAGEAAGSAGDLLGDATGTATKGGLPTDSLTQGGGLPGAQTLPVKSLPLG
ncbi:MULTISPECIES: ATP-binding protein [unclassified Streptomyces]|uniref:ATP-binding protein n=1 Tax=unclassified Streptomyces TaxID=2593676 RepID=UPI003D707E29